MKIAAFVISEAFMACDYELAVSALAEHYEISLPETYDLEVMLDQDLHPEVVIKAGSAVYGWNKIIGLYSGGIVPRYEMCVTIFDTKR
jgi:hypothetical protein